MTVPYLVLLGIGLVLLIATLAGAGRRASDSPELSVWLPVASTRFWSVFLLAGGGVGAILSAQGVAAAGVIAAISVVLGWVAGVVAVTIARAIHGTAIDPNAPLDLTGATATVVEKIPEGGVGAVRLDASGERVPAEGEYSAAVAAGAGVTVVGRGAGGRVLVRG